MSVAAIEACLLHDLLAAASTEGKGTDGLASTFLTEAQKVIETPWSTSAVPDFLDPLTEGPRPPDLENRLKYGAAMLKVAAEDPAVHKVLLEVQNLVTPPSCSASAGDRGSRQGGVGDSLARPKVKFDEPIS